MLKYPNSLQNLEVCPGVLPPAFVLQFCPELPRNEPGCQSSSQFALHCKDQLYILPLLGHLHLRDDSKMKTWLLVLLVSFQIVMIESATDESKTFNLENPDSMVKTRNNDRKKAAEEKNFAAMWKLEWSDELLQKIKTLPNDCNALTPGSGYRFELIAQGRPSAEWAHREGLYMLHHNPDVLQHSTAFTQERYQPSQKQIACAEYKCENRKSFDPTVQKTANFKAICLFGPNEEFTFTTREGSPGSECEKEEGENEDGLCVPSESSGSSVLLNFSIMASLVLLVSVIFD
ncbi:unnamed protein product [Caenorhabditis brenneri]